MVAAVPGAGVLLTRGTAVHLHGEAEKEVDGYDGHPDALADGRRGQAAEAEAREENSVLGPREHRVHRLGAATAIVRKSVTADQPMARPTCRATVGQYLASSTLSSLVGYCRRSLQTQNLGGTSKAKGQASFTNLRLAKWPKHQRDQARLRDAPLPQMLAVAAATLTGAPPPSTFPVPSMSAAASSRLPSERSRCCRATPFSRHCCLPGGHARCGAGRRPLGADHHEAV